MMEIIQLVIGSSGLLGILILVFRFGKLAEKVEHLDKRMDKFEMKMEDRFNKIDDQFNKIDERFMRVDDHFKEVKKDINEVNIRISILEAETVIYQSISEPNARSEAAKSSWKRRKSKLLEAHV